jgi:hypothetical protein
MAGATGSSGPTGSIRDFYKGWDVYNDRPAGVIRETPDELTVWAVALGLKDDVDRLIKNSFESHDGTNAGVWAPLWFTGSGGFGSVGNVTSMLSSISTTAVSSSGSGYGGGGGGGGF